MLVLLGCCLIYYLYAVSVGLRNTLYSDLHGFRQSQTAMGCFWMLRGGPLLRYETPALGPPWSAPWEFPLYQWVVVLIVRVTRFPLDVVGRLVSIASYLLCIGIVALIAPRIGFAGPLRWLLPCLMLVSPFYVFWSRTFLIETTALLFATAYAASLIYCRDYARYAIPLAILFGTAAALVKVTTFVVFWLAAATYLVMHVGPLHAAALLCGTAMLPAIAFKWWSRIGDAEKQKNPLSRVTQISSKPISYRWFFGTWRQRFSPNTWRRILNYHGSIVHDDVVFWLICLAAVIVTRRRWEEVVTCAALFAAAPLILTNVHWVHDYYTCANGVFLLGAVAFAVLGVFESTTRPSTPAGYVATAVVIVACVLTHRRRYYLLQAKNCTTLKGLTTLISSRCEPDAVLIFVGFDWNPSLPYYAERRALMIPDWAELTEEDIRKALGGLVGYKIGGLVVERPARRATPDFIMSTLKSFGIQVPHVYTRDPRAVPLTPDLRPALHGGINAGLSPGVIALPARHPGGNLSSLQKTAQSRSSHG
jgi:hypothetical protein